MEGFRAHHGSPKVVYAFETGLTLLTHYALKMSLGLCETVASTAAGLLPVRAPDAAPILLTFRVRPTATPRESASAGWSCVRMGSDLTLALSAVALHAMGVQIHASRESQALARARRG